METNDDLDKRVVAIGKLLEMFKFERMVYLTVTILSLIVLICCAVYMIFIQKNNDLIPAIIAMFGSSGGIAFTCGRLLKMWSDAMQILAPLNSK